MINLLMPYPAALITAGKKRILVIADLHIGWELALSQKGIHVTTQMPKLLETLEHLIHKYEPDKLMILGDVKHTVATAKMGEWKHVPDFFDKLKDQIEGIQVIRGNHDGNLKPLLPQNVTILSSAGVVEGDVGLFHGHRWPSPSLLQCKTLMMGHVHPVVAFLDPAGFRITRQVWVKTECDGAKLAKTLLRKNEIDIKGNAEKTLRSHYKIKPLASQLFIMPSFNDFLGGRPLNKRKNKGNAEKTGIIGPVLRSEAVDMEKAETYLLDGTFLGNLNQLRSLN
jgi:hypothetical protein